MKTVWKFPIEATEIQSVQMPRGAQILYVGVQGEGLRMKASVWALCDTDQPKAERRLAVTGTGHDAAHCEGPHVGTFMLGNGALVFHVFDLGE